MTLDNIKTPLREGGTDFDEAEIIPMICACLDDLRLAGVRNVSDTWENENDSLIIRAVVLYCKAHFGYEEEAERYLDFYENLKTAMASSRKYRTEVEIVVGEEKEVTP